jgi:hypothetical protein
MAGELTPYGVTALALTPGRLPTEALPMHGGHTKSLWGAGPRDDPNVLASETPDFVGRAVVALATDPSVARKAGGLFSTWGLAAEYGFARDGAG